RIDMQLGGDDGAEHADEGVPLPHLPPPAPEQPARARDDQVAAVRATFGAFHHGCASRSGWATSTIVSRRTEPRRFGQSIALPRRSPISAAPTGVSTDTRPRSMSAARGYTSSTECSS